MADDINAAQVNRLWRYNSGGYSKKQVAVSLRGKSMLRQLESPLVTREQMIEILYALVKRSYPQIEPKLVAWTDYPHDTVKRGTWYPVEVVGYDNDKYVQVILPDGAEGEIKLGYLYTERPDGDNPRAYTHKEVSDFIPLLV